MLPVAAFLGSSIPAGACIPPTMDVVNRISSVIVEGEFVISDGGAGAGYIVPKRVKKGKRLTRYEVRWDPHEEEKLQSHEIDCMVSIPESGTSEIFYLFRNSNKMFNIIGRAGR
ncbi:hypothetical protein GCM10011494_20820 [Novosphingobium endophyticum]|uniref:Uncharacterized protein n=2 Tax=Novosphingobium endophyticum TaxID=1955250 RepID=A0A916X4L4_9SPHN|nr:hypothetical protein GCM10011494_20820 [Novosphingobium endophyticum]